METTVTHFNGGAGTMIMPCLMAVIALLLFAFWIWILIDCATKEAAQGNTKIVWILIIVLASWVGALIYYFVRRPQRLRETGQ